MTIQKILVVDDSDVDRGHLVRTLLKAGFDVLEAHDGQDALNKVMSFTPDLVIMDMIMPNTSGMDACRAMANAPETKHIPVIACSSRGLKSDSLYGKDYGVAEYLVKPVDAKELLIKIQALG